MNGECLCDDCDYYTCLCEMCESRETCKDEDFCSLYRGPEKPKKTKRKTAAVSPATKQTNGGSAFPSVVGDVGMSLRDYFAGQALVAYQNFHSFDEMMNRPEIIAKCAYKIAGAMLEERAKKKND